jgi:hypothetical protein
VSIAARAAPRVLVPLYALALFVSALLAFWIQPLFAKIILPRYGGSPAVWTTAALFFQLALLAGYLYAHLASRLALRAQLALHALLIASALAMLPISASSVGAGADAPVLSLLAVLAVSLGFPVFALSATAPLLQQWFSRTGHRHAADPYFLYSASNAGSLLALIGYPLVLEPLLGLKQQTLAWSAACAVFAALVFACGAAVWRGRPVSAAAPVATRPAAAPLTWRVRARWMLLALAPSSLMLGVTQHITSEIAAAPLLWLIPLTIYILTFVVAFARTKVLPARAVDRVQPLLVVALVLVWPLDDHVSVLVLHLVVFAVTAMMCHAELARTRPDVQHLTAFYLWLAIGGAAGGAFNALVAPVAFDSVLEYPLALALACALRPAPPGMRPGLWKELLPAAALAAAAAALIATDTRPFASTWTAVAYLQVVGVGLYLAHRRPLQFALAVFTVIIATPFVHSAERLLERHRSFFGVHSVLVDDTGAFHVLMHGITIHGAQYIAPDKRTRPTTYFHADSPIGQVFSVLGREGRLERVAVIGMGTGTLACHRAPQREWTFYEIDPVVVKLAQDGRHFDFLARCAPDARIVVGDGRLSIARAPDAAYDLIVIDTFSSDAIPAHMVTREALALYLRKAAAGGVVAFHVTNQYLDLLPVLARLAADAGVAAYVPGPRLDLQLDERLAALPSSWVAVARDAARLAPLAADEGWIPMPAPAPGRLWTDDFSNILSAIK